MKRPSHRIFDYSPRFYKPEKDEQEKRKKKLGFSRQLKHKRKRRSPVIWILFILIILFAIFKLTRLG